MFESKSFPQFLDYLKVKDLLVAMGFIPEGAASADSKERALLYDMWKLLKGEEQDEVKLSDLKVFLQGILRLYEHPRILQGEVREGNTEIGFFNEKNQFCLAQDDLA